jgi:iron complex outermembrane receptor protein
MAAAAPAFAQDEGEIADPNTDVVVSVGTRRAERSASDSPAPIDVVDGKELLNQGDNDIQNLLRTSVPSYNVNTQPISDAATIVRPANLRGLPPDSTLVLVNGKRRHRAAVISFLGGGLSDGSQGADINVFPAIALKQVEVLRDGASSQYGSDAIAGVVNFVLKDDRQGASFEAEWGQTYEGDGDQWSISGNVGLPIGAEGFINISAEYGETDATDRSVQRGDAAALIAAGNTAVQDISVNTVTTDHVQIWGQPNVNDDIKVFVNSAIPFSDAFELYALGNYAERQVEGGFFYRNPNTRGGVFSNDGGATLLVGDLTADGSGACPVVNIVNNVPDPVALGQVIADPDCFSFVEMFPGGFTPRFGGDVRDYSAIGGFRGSLGERFTYDFSFTRGDSKVEFFINNTINASLGPNTPTSFTPGAYEQKDTNFNADFTYALPNKIFSSDLNLAFGFEHRKEEFTITAGQPESFQIGPLSAPSVAFPNGQGFSSSSNGFPGFTTAAAGVDSQKNYAVYGEVETDITQSLSVLGAVRYEDFYDSFGGTTNWKAGLKYDFTDNFLVRATYSTGFHAPTAGQANVINTTTQFNGTTLVDLGTLPLSSPAGQFIADRLFLSTGSRPTLGPEESRNVSVGFAYSGSNFGLTVDYFNIAVRNRISLSDTQDFLAELIEVATENAIPVPPGSTTSQVLNLLDANNILDSADFAGFQDLSQFSFFTNSFDTRTQGIDVVANTSFDLSSSWRTTAAVAFNWTDTDITDFGLGSAAPLGGGRAKQIEDSLPATRGNLTLNHYIGKFRGLTRLNYYGKFFECHVDATNNAAPPTFCDLPHNGSAQFTVDLEAGLEISEGVEIMAGAQNVFDSYPDELIPAFQGIVGSRYPAVAPGGYKGGFYYFRVRADF